VNQGRIYVRLTPHHERIFSLSRMFSVQPWKAFQNNYTQRQVMQEVRKR